MLSLLPVGRFAFFGLLVFCALGAIAAEPLQDISILGSQSEAVVRIVNQGIMAPISPGLFGPQEPTTRRQFAVAVQRLFQLAPPPNVHAFRDVPSTDPDFAAINSVAPQMQAQAFCPGCALNANFGPEAPMSVTQEAATLASVLSSRGKIELVSASDAGSILAPAANLSRVPKPAQIFIATAVKNGIVALDGLLGRSSVPVSTRANTALLLDSVQQTFHIPAVRAP